MRARTAGAHEPRGALPAQRADPVRRALLQLQPRLQDQRGVSDVHAPGQVSARSDFSHASAAHTDAHSVPGMRTARSYCKMAGAGPWACQGCLGPNCCNNPAGFPAVPTPSASISPSPTAGPASATSTPSATAVLDSVGDSAPPGCETEPCRNGGTCTDANTGYVCGWIAGYTGPTDSETDVDDCDPNPCEYAAAHARTQ